MHKLSKKNNTVFYIILGITGDLSYKKIIPSLWYLYKHKKLPPVYKVIGIARRLLNKEEFKKYIYDSINSHTGDKIDTTEFDNFFYNFIYLTGDLDNKELFINLNKQTEALDKSLDTPGNKVFYLATNPNLYNSIFNNLAAVGLNKPKDKNSWVRMLIEKPFGTDLKTAKELGALLLEYFDEEQIYRIDHYLFKEIIQGIENFRFSNNLFENNWNNTTIEKIEIKLFEEMGVENRGSFYDSMGTLRDVGQNHLLEMLSAIISEPSTIASNIAFRENIEKALSLLPNWTEESIKENTKRAQYDGYLNIKGVSENSKTETYFSFKTELVGSKWGGVSVFMEAGKKMGEVRKEIMISFRQPKICLLCNDSEHRPNKIIFRFDPNDEIKIHFYTKKPGFKNTIEERAFTFFLYEKETKVQYVEEYSKALLSVVDGDRTKFISSKEVECSWNFIDPILKAWSNDLVSLGKYKQNTSPDFRDDKSDIAQKEIGIIGLGKMGTNISRRLLGKGWNVIGYNRSSEATDKLKANGLIPAYSLEEFVKKIKSPRLIWNMTPHTVTGEILKNLEGILDDGDTVIDGGNSNYKDSIERSKKFNEKNINFLDVGVSGGPGGALNGACLMIGGPKKIFNKNKNLFIDLSVEDGYKYVGESGAGHFVKMIHNGIEYGMMQAIGEGFNVMKNAPFDLNLKEVVDIYNHGSVIESKLTKWLYGAYKKFGQELDSEECCSGEVSHSGEGQWTVDTAKELGIPVTVIENSLEFRKKSKEKPTYTGKVVSALRHEFGGHDTSGKK